MLLTISSTSPATDLGYLLHKNPARVQTEELSFGKAHVFYPAADASRCTVAVLLEVDPIALVGGRKGPAGEGGQLQQYVNDRPYAANSFLGVVLGRLFSTALNGRSKERPELANTSLPLSAKLRYSSLHHPEASCAWTTDGGGRNQRTARGAQIVDRTRTRISRLRGCDCFSICRRSSTTSEMLPDLIASLARMW